MLCWEYHGESWVLLWRVAVRVGCVGVASGLVIWVGEVQGLVHMSTCLRVWSVS